MKNGKSDVLFDFTSDLLTHGPPILIDHIVNMFRSFVIHGSVPFFLLICTLVPIIKDKMDNHASSDNYRAIAISILILKLFDWCILLLEGNKLGCHELQYGFQPSTSTNMCSWALNTVIDYSIDQEHLCLVAQWIYRKLSTLLIFVNCCHDFETQQPK